MQATRLGDFVFRTVLALSILSTLGATDARAEDKLLAETVDFTGTFIFLEAKVPGAIVGVIRNG